MVSGGLTLETRNNGPPRDLMGPNRTTEHQQAVVRRKSALSAVLAHRYLSFSDGAPRRLTPNVPDGFETRGIGPGAECGRPTHALSEAMQRPTREHQPEAARPIKSASLGISPHWVFVLSFPSSPNTQRFGGFENSGIGREWNTGALRMDYRDMCTSARRGT